MKKLLLILSLLITGALTMVAESSYTITFAKGTTSTDPSTALTTNNFKTSAIASDCRDMISAVDSTANCFGPCQNGLKMSSSKKSGSFKITLAQPQQVAPTRIEVACTKFGSDSPTLTVKVNDEATTISSSSVGTNSVLSADLNLTGNIQTIEVDASKRLYISSITMYTAAGIVETKVKTPKFSPTAGMIAEGNAVSISCDTEGATILYGFSEDAIANTYTNPIIINADCTIYAKATKSGLEDSEVADAAYTVYTPFVWPTGGSWNLVTSASQLVDGGLYLITTASATNNGYKTVAITQENDFRQSTGITISDNTATPTDQTGVFRLGIPAANSYTFFFENYLGGAGYIGNNNTSKNYCQVVSSLPSDSVPYTATITIDAEHNTAITFGTKRGNLQYNSASPRFACYSNPQTPIALYHYEDGTLPQPSQQVSTPTFSETPGTLTSGTTVTISCATEGATIKYGFASDQITNVYSQPVAITSDCTLYAQATKEGMTDSEVAQVSYSVKATATQVAEPEFVVNGNAVITGNACTAIIGSTITISCATPDALLTLTATDTGDEYPEVETTDATLPYTFTVGEAMELDGVLSKEGLDDRSFTLSISIVSADTQASFDFTRPYELTSSNTGVGTLVPTPASGSQLLNLADGDYFTNGTVKVVVHNHQSQSATRLEYGTGAEGKYNHGWALRVYKEKTGENYGDYIVVETIDGSALEEINFFPATGYVHDANSSKCEWLSGIKVVAKPGDTTSFGTLTHADQFAQFTWQPPTSPAQSPKLRAFTPVTSVAFEATDETLYIGRIEVGHAGVNTGIENVEAQQEAESSVTEYYNVQGIRCQPESLTPGFYIRRQGHSTSKVIIR